MRKKRLPRPGEAVKVGRRMVVLPGVRSIADSDPAAPSTPPGAGEAEKPTNELSDELIRTIKAAYQ